MVVIGLGVVGYVMVYYGGGDHDVFSNGHAHIGVKKGPHDGSVVARNEIILILVFCAL